MPKLSIAHLCAYATLALTEMDIAVRKSTSAKSKLIIVVATRPALTQWAALTVSAMLASSGTESTVFVIQTNATRTMVVVEKIRFVTTQVDRSSVCVTTDT